MTATVIPGPWPGVVIRRRRGVPPTAGYLAERERLGIPSGAQAITVRCPWCGAPAFKPCTVNGTGRFRPPHEARIEAAA
jgi:hypothetical protein